MSDSKEEKKGPRLECRFYRTDAGSEPVREWLKALDPSVCTEIGAAILLVQWRWPIGKPLVDGMGDGLFEVRISLGGNTYRVLFSLDDSAMVLLHGFMKKTMKTPKADLELARTRKAKVETK